ncbi:MAG: Hpt domain-containing protein [Syntrophaceae bacterium]|jgi:HPt (histidine-containing phosphotransfer) domain-containing protein|nr:Hpt domain-containing protein [Syntrophaceae bacterium]
MTDQEKVVSTDTETVIIDEELEDLIPGYLENRRQDIALILSALERNDFETIRAIGHKMKGSGGGYGFDRITEIGRDLEAEAKRAINRDIQERIHELRDYLDRVQIVFQP